MKFWKPEHLRYKKTAYILAVVHFCTGGIGGTALSSMNHNVEEFLKLEGMLREHLNHRLLIRLLDSLSILNYFCPSY